MTKFQALYILFLREKCEGSYRWVAANYNNRYVKQIPFQGIKMSINGNQLEGIELIKKSNQILKLNIE